MNYVFNFYKLCFGLTCYIQFAWTFQILTALNELVNVFLKSLILHGKRFFAGLQADHFHRPLDGRNTDSGFIPDDQSSGHSIVDPRCLVETRGAYTDRQNAGYRDGFVANVIADEAWGVKGSLGKRNTATPRKGNDVCRKMRSQSLQKYSSVGDYVKYFMRYITQDRCWQECKCRHNPVDYTNVTVTETNLPHLQGQERPHYGYA